MAETEGGEGKKTGRIFAEVRPALLTWGRSSAGLSIEQAAKKLAIKPSKLSSIEAGVEKPSVPQLRKMALAYKRPLAAFFLPEAPPPSPAVHDFRRLTGDLDALHASPALLFELRRARRRRAVALQLLSELESRVPDFALSASQSEPVSEVAKRAREWIGIPLSTQQSWQGKYDALNGWVSAMEQRGILVFQAATVPLREMRGFSLAERILPTVVLNGKDRPRARVFTLIHEFAHLMLNDGGVCDPFRHLAADAAPNAVIEAFCNQVAGSVLVPSEALQSLALYRSRSGDSAWDDSAIREIADIFAVSREVAVLRLHHLNRVSAPFVAAKLKQYQDEYRAFDQAASQQQPDPKRRGLPPYKAALRENGKQYTRLVFDALERDRITLADASDYLGLRVNHFEKLGNAVIDVSEAR